MGVIKQGGTNPHAGDVLTTRGYKDGTSATRQCGKCGLYKDDPLFTVDANGTAICASCTSWKEQGAIRQTGEDIPDDFSDG